MHDRDDQIHLVFVEAARLQLATVSAGIAFWSSWMQSAGRLADAAERELLSIADGTGDADRVMRRLADLKRQFLRDLAELPTQARERLAEELATTDGPGLGPRSSRARRAARARR